MRFIISRIGVEPGEISKGCELSGVRLDETSRGWKRLGDLMWDSLHVYLAE